MLRFDSLEALGRWAAEYRVTSVQLGADGQLTAATFSEQGPALELLDGDDDADDARPKTAMDAALERMLQAGRGARA